MCSVREINRTRAMQTSKVHTGPYVPEPPCNVSKVTQMFYLKHLEPKFPWGEEREEVVSAKVMLLPNGQLDLKHLNPKFSWARGEGGRREGVSAETSKRQ